MIKIAYIAGPMTGELCNFPAFDEARDTLTEIGYKVISPADLDRKAGFNPQSSTVDKKFLDQAMARDLAALQLVDTLFMLPGWKKSTGATAEYHLARWRHIPIFEYPSFKQISKQHHTL